MPAAFPSWLSVVAVMAGGALGSLCRYAVGVYLLQAYGSGAFLGTLAVNLIGCFVMGIIASEGMMGLSQPTRLFAVTGFLGGFTTFSAFGYEVWLLAKAGDVIRLSAYVAVSVGGGALLVWLGAKLGQVFG